MDTVIGIVVIGLIVWAVAAAAKNKPRPQVIPVFVKPENGGCVPLIAAGLLVLALAGAALACF
jgi:hypothetical protein